MTTSFFFLHMKAFKPLLKKDNSAVTFDTTSAAFNMLVQCGGTETL